MGGVPVVALRRHRRRRRRHHRHDLFLLGLDAAAFSLVAVGCVAVVGVGLAVVLGSVVAAVAPAASVYAGFAVVGSRADFAAALPEVSAAAAAVEGAKECGFVVADSDSDSDVADVAAAVPVIKETAAADFGFVVAGSASVVAAAIVPETGAVVSARSHFGRSVVSDFALALAARVESEAVASVPRPRFGHYFAVELPPLQNWNSPFAPEVKAGFAEPEFVVLLALDAASDSACIVEGQAVTIELVVWLLMLLLRVLHHLPLPPLPVVPLYSLLTLMPRLLFRRLLHFYL